MMPNSPRERAPHSQLGTLGRCYTRWATINIGWRSSAARACCPLPAAPLPCATLGRCRAGWVPHQYNTGAAVRGDSADVHGRPCSILPKVGAGTQACTFLSDVFVHTLQDQRQQQKQCILWSRTRCSQRGCPGVRKCPQCWTRASMAVAASYVTLRCCPQSAGA